MGIVKQRHRQYTSSTILTPIESRLYIRITDPHLSIRITDLHHQPNPTIRTAIKPTPTLSTSVSSDMTEGPSNSFISSMQLNMAIPVPTMATKSQTPYSGPDLVTALPTEIFQGIASNSNADSIKALRLTIKAAAVKSQFNFVVTCRQSMTVDMTKVGIRRGLHNLQKDFVSASTKHVTFTTFSTEKGALQKGLLQNGSRPNSRVNLPTNGDVKAVLGHAPNVTNIVLRDTTSGESLVPQFMCKALATLPRVKLTDLTIDGCTVDCKTLKNLLNAHRHTLRCLVLRNLTITDGDFTYAFLSKLGTDFGLNRLVLDQLYNTDGKCFTVQHPSKLNSFVVGNYGTENFLLHEHQCNDCHKFQGYLLREDMASMTGHAGVQEGIAMIVKAKGH